MTREEAIQILLNLQDGSGQTYEAIRMAIEALSAEATKKKAELKENGDWDCPDVYCDECTHNRSVSWCSLAIPSHEEIDDTYKMVSEAFFEGVEVAEKRYRFLIETVEELEEKSADSVEVVLCKNCIHWKADNEVFEMGFCCVFPQKWVAETFYCADGERREE